MPEGQPPIEEVANRLAHEVLVIHRETYGVGAAEARAHIHDDEVIVTLDRIELLANERFLISRGQAEMVIQTRSAYQTAVRDSFSAAVERATGRRVIGFSSITNLDPDYVVEYFRLGPEVKTDLKEPDQRQTDSV